MNNKLYKNKKTDRVYEILNDTVFNATNAQNGQRMILYKLVNMNTNMIFVREKEEFFEKFELVGEITHSEVKS